MSDNLTQKRHKYPSPEMVKLYATPLSRWAWGGAKVITRLLPKNIDIPAHVGEGVFLTRCNICGECFLNPDASPRPGNLASHMFDEHNIYDGYLKPHYG